MNRLDQNRMQRERHAGCEINPLVHAERLALDMCYY